MSVRAKFRITTLSPSSISDKGTTGTVKLSPVMPKYNSETRSYEESENKTFWDATPSGEITMHINNPAGFAFFAERMGQEFYVDFTATN